ncbi:MAG: 50S ribosomal protein L6 [Thermoplasmatota archaeon]
MAAASEIKEAIPIPDGVMITIEGFTVHVKGEKGSISKKMFHPSIHITVKNNTVEIVCSDSPKRKEKALIGTFKAHIKNMIKGVTQGFEYQMKTVYSHFPIKTGVEGDRFVIQNFLGERYPRYAKILEGVTVKTNAENVTISGIDKEKVGQTAVNIERATRVRKRDIRVFQDGVYLINKGG